MKNKLFGIVVLAVVMVFVTSCATMSTVGGTSDPHGFFNGNGNAELIIQGAEEIANYSVILGIIDSGFDKYALAVTEAQAAGKQIYSITKWMFVLTKTTAYAK